MDSEEREKRVGPWRLLSTLGEGGNATVWSAVQSDGDLPIALKVLNSSKAEREPYRRFVREIEFLRGIGETPGVLPLLDANLPAIPSTTDRPWLAMPVARPIGEALAGQSLEAVVAAVEAIASTLAELKSTHSIAHRDVKPQNLYELGGNWLVGDFGLIHAPDLEELTRSGRPLGPAHYTAYELINDPLGADPFPADVYSLAKTIWVLATGQRFPPDGHQEADSRGFRIQDFSQHAHAAALDQLVDNMTLIDPRSRPTMEQVVKELQAWSALASQPVVLDVSELGARFRAKKEIELAANDVQARNKELALALVRRMQELMIPLNEALRGVGAELDVDAMDDKLTNNICRSLDHQGAARNVFRWQRCTRLRTGPAHYQYQLRMGRGIELLEDGEVLVHTLVNVGHVRVNSTAFNWRSTGHSAPVGTVESEKMLQDVISELLGQLRPAIEAFVENA
jgi:hypothetical protein